MNNISVSLNSKDQIREFIQINTKSGCQVDVSDGRSFIDGKSLLGLLSLALFHPLSVSLIGEDASTAKVFEAYKEHNLLAV
ncbi:hypothetical protein SAMN06296386_114101 [Lachnospiraceae bacterium]|nr:hypothetical protein SAMN06296386_114101 [Lachnospiraceae bacterium]